MKRAKNFYLFITIVLLILFSHTSVFSENISKDYLFLLDTSGSMVGEGAGNPSDIFDDVKQSIKVMIDDLPLEENSSVTIMTFDQGINKNDILMKELTSYTKKEILKNHIDRLTATGDVTWITHGLNAALNKLTGLRKNRKGKKSYQYLYMFTDTRNTGPGTPPISFEEIREKHDLKKGEFHLALYCIAYGVPKDVKEEFEQEFPPNDIKSNVSIQVVNENPKVNKIIPINLKINTDKESYYANEAIKIFTNPAPNIKLDSIKCNVLRPDGDIDSIYLLSKNDIYQAKYESTEAPGEYEINIPEETYKQNYKIWSDRSRKIEVDKCEISLKWENLRRLGPLQTQQVDFTIISENTTEEKTVSVSLFSDDERLSILRNGEPAEDFSVTLQPSDNKDNVIGKFSATFHANDKLGWLSGVKFKVQVNEEEKFEGRVLQPIPFLVWLIIGLIIVVIVILIGRIILTPYRFKNKIYLDSEGRENYLDGELQTQANILSYVLINDNSQIGISIFGLGYWYEKNLETGNVTRGMDNIDKLMINSNAF